MHPTNPLKMWTALAAAAVLSLSAGALAGQTPPSTPPPPPPSDLPPPPPAPPPMPDVSQIDDATKTEALHIMGYSMAQQLGLGMFSEGELEKILEGMRLLAKGEPEPARLQEMMPYAQAIYRDKREAQQQAEEAKAAAEAEKNKAAAATFWNELSAKPGIVKAESGLHYEILAAGSEKKPGPRDRVKVLYRGTLVDGTEFDQSMDREKPATFGVNRVVPGFGEGLQLIGEGGKIKLFIPPELGYGNNPRQGGVIKPGDTLVFEVELLEVLPPPTPRAPPSLPPGVTPPPGAPPVPTTPPPPPPAGLRPPGPPPNITPPPPPNVTPPPPPSAPPATKPPAAETH